MRPLSLKDFSFRLKRKFIRFLYRNSPEPFMPGTRLNVLCNMYSIIGLRTPRTTGYQLHDRRN